MDDDPLINLDLLQGLDPDFFTACGRALYVAQHFEKNLQGVTAALDLRAAHNSGELRGADTERLSDFCRTKLKRSLGKSIKEGLANHLPESLVEDFAKHVLPSLDKAREARNRVAHEFLFGVERTEVPSDVFEEIAGSLRNDVRILADADFTVCCIIQGFNHAPMPCCRERYVNGLIRWVLSPLGRHISKKVNK